MSTPTVQLPQVVARRPTADDRRKLIRRAKALSWLSLGWMTVEGAVAITAGLLAGSVALVGFGIDSAIEGLASVIVIWRFTGSRTFSEAAELRAQRLVAIGSRATAGEGTQNLLCAYMAAGVLAGLLANTLAGWWWFDPVIALGIAGLALKEGRQTWGGTSCDCCAIDVP